VSGSRELGGDERFLGAFLYRRSGNTWTPIRLLGETQEYFDFRIPAAIAMRDGVAVVQGPTTRVYEFDGSDWVAATDEIVTDAPGAFLRIDGGRALSGEGACSSNGRVLAKSADGVWRAPVALEGYGVIGGCDNDQRGGPVDIAGSWAVVSQPLPDPDVASGRQALLYRDYGGGNGFDPFPYGSASAPVGNAPFGEDVALFAGAGDALDVIVSGSDASGSHLFREIPARGFQLAGSIQPVDGYMGSGRARKFLRVDDLLFQLGFSADRGVNVVNVFQRSDAGTYDHVAILAARNGDSLGSAMAADGRRVLIGGSGNGLVYAFELSALNRRSPVHDTFSSGNGAGWTPSAGSAFATVQSGASRVYRQSETTIATRAVYDAVDWTSQAIEADVKPVAFGASGGGVGLATRYQSPSNYFEAVIRNTGRVELRRVASGAMRVLAAAAFAPVAGKTYRLRLESVGTLHRVLVDGTVLLDADSTGPTHGRAALVTDRASAEFDNVTVSPSLTATIYATGFEDGAAGPWKRTGLGYWNLWTGTSTVWNQSSIAGYTRAAIGAVTDDQVVRVRTRLDTFATPNGTDQRWFGVMARHVDSSNYYYLSLRNTNTVSLRKFVDGAATTLATASFTVTPATWYSLRLDAVGNQLRGYVDGRLVVEATDSSHPRGNAGPVMYKAAADFDDYRASQP
jgi:hypothetical protein